MTHIQFWHYKARMWMMYFKVPAKEYYETLKRLDGIAPDWKYANDDTFSKRATEIIRVADMKPEQPVQLWVLFKNKQEAMMAKLSFQYEEFGRAVWKDKREELKNHYFYTRYPVMQGWFIEQDADVAQG